MSVEKFLRNVILVGVFILPFLPLVVSSSMFFPFITGKNFAFRIIVELIFAAWLILAIYRPTYRPKRSWILWFAVAFVGIIAIADIFGESFFKSFWSNFERMEGLIALLHLLAYFFVVGTVLKTEKIWTRLFQTSVGVSVIIGVYGLLQLAGTLAIHQGGVRLDATFGNATYLAIYMVFHLFITAWLWYRHREHKAAHWVYGVAIVLQAVNLYYTATRGAILGFLGGLLLALVLVAIFGKGYPGTRKVSIVVIIALVVVVGTFVALRNTSVVHDNAVLGRLANISLTERTVQSRFLVWDTAWQGFKERPILGWGQEGFIYVFGKHYNPDMWNQEPWFDRAHNIVFDWLIAGGILGLLSYLGLFGAALYLLWRHDSGFSILEKSLFTGLFAGYAFHNLFVFDNAISYWIFFTLLAFFHARSTTSGTEAVDDTTNRLDTTQNTKYILASLVIIALASSLYFFNIRTINVARTLLHALAPQASGPVGNLELYEKAILYNTLGKQEAREQLGQAATRAFSLNISNQLKQDFVNTARRELLLQMQEDPTNPRYPLFLGVMLRYTGFYQESIQYIEKAIELSPKKQFALFELAGVYISLREYDRAFEILKFAFELAPEYDRARKSYAVAAIYVGRNDIVEGILIPRYGTVTPEGGDNDTDINLIQAYFDTGQHEKVVEIWQKRVERVPNNPQFRLSLAAAYVNAGQSQNAIIEIRRIIELNPEFKEQGEALIRDIQLGRAVVQ